MPFIRKAKEKTLLGDQSMMLQELLVLLGASKINQNKTMKKLSFIVFLCLSCAAITQAQTRVTSYDNNNEGRKGTDNVFLGTSAGAFTSNGSQNIFAGYQAGLRNKTGIGNVYLGHRAGQDGGTVGNNVIIGRDAGRYNKAGSNVVLGAEAGEYNEGSRNILLGYQTGVNNVGRYNIFLGEQAGSKNAGEYNVFMGFQSGLNNTTGKDNTFIGKLAGRDNTTGNNNLFMGNIAGHRSTTGNNNTFVGMEAGRGNTKGYDNVFMGYQAGFGAMVGDRNIFIGNSAGRSTSSGNNNVSIGYQAGYSNSLGSSSVFLGYQAGYDETKAGRLYIANSRTRTLIYGEFYSKKVGINTITPEATLDVNGSMKGHSLTLNVGSFPDYVFEADYDLMPLEKVDAYIKKHGHLPKVPKAAKVIKEGMNVAQMNVLLMEKVEELTLYTIALKKELDQLKQQVNKSTAKK